MREKPDLDTWMEGGLDYIMLQHLNTDGIRTIGSVLGQSIALDYYVRQVFPYKLVRFDYVKTLIDDSSSEILICPFRLMEWLQSLLILIVKWKLPENLR